MSPDSFCLDVVRPALRKVLTLLLHNTQMSFTARGYGGYHDVVGSATESPLGGVEDWSPHQAEKAEHEVG